MNDRMKELAAKSNFGHMENGEVVYDHRLEKFAELIVQECADLVDTLNEAYEAPSTAGKFIKNHFGIEIHSDKGYEIGTIEECEKFAESRRKPFGKNE
jgi:hypothetical protein